MASRMGHVQFSIIFEDHPKFWKSSKIWRSPKKMKDRMLGGEAGRGPGATGGTGGRGPRGGSGVLRNTLKTDREGTLAGLARVSSSCGLICDSPRSQSRATPVTPTTVARIPQHQARLRKTRWLSGPFGQRQPCKRAPESHSGWLSQPYNTFRRKSIIFR